MRMLLRSISRRLWSACLTGTILTALLVLIGIAVLLARPGAREASSRSAHAPPWIYGKPSARFTLIEYADLECPYCRRYAAALRPWIDAHPEVNWQWHHRPLSIHEPAAMHEARLAECAGTLGGNDAFWRMVGWIYAHTRGNGAGLPADTLIPGMTARLQSCMVGPLSLAAVTRQADAATRDHIDATPTVRLLDHQTGRNLTLQGAVDGDALLSAMDFLAAPAAASSIPTKER